MSSVPRRFTPLIRVLIVFVVYEIALYVVIPVVQVLGVGTESSPAVTNVTKLVMGAVHAGVLLALVRLVDRRPLSILRLVPDASAVKAFLVSLLLTGAIVVVGAWLAVETGGLDQHEAGTEAGGWLGVFITAFFLQAFPEELAFRGVMVETLESTPLRTMAVTSIAFMLLHWHYIPMFIRDDRGVNDPMMPVWLVADLYAMLVLGALAFVSMYLFRSIWGAVAVHFGHMVFDDVANSLGLDNVPQRGLVISVLMTIVVVVALVRFKEAFRPANNIIVYD